MTPEELNEIDVRIATDYQGCRSLRFLLSDTRELRAHISTLESELQQVKVERDGLRDGLEMVILKSQALLAAMEGSAVEHFPQETRLHAAIQEAAPLTRRAALAPAPVARTETEC